MQPTTVTAGTLIGERFVIEEVAGHGGMGTVYRAHTVDTNELVAVKILPVVDPASEESKRILREARLLSDLQHPGIVRYIAHGQRSTGQPYLVMEWLEGEDLAKRLVRGPLTIGQSVRLIEQIAQALSFAHQRAVVHRDIKPGNLFLRHGRLEGVALLDFGIARRIPSVKPMTRTGAVLGTPEYMAPEQARGGRGVTPAADVFSLGCVLFECLTGRPPFLGEHLAALLARILFYDAPALGAGWRNISPQLDDLLRRMLSKDARNRPADATALLAELRKLPATTDELAVAVPSLPERGLSDREQQLVSIVMAVGRDDAAGAGTTHERAEVRAVLDAHRVHGDWLADGTLCATLRAADSAVDLVASAARVALATHAVWPEATLAVATGPCQILDQQEVGDAVERAVELLRRQSLRRVNDVDGEVVAGAQIWLDQLSADLLDGRFVVVEKGDLRLLRGQTAAQDGTRLLLGKPTPFVGRDQDLAALEVALSKVIEQPMAQMVLLCAMPGMGKSRLAQEFLRGLSMRGVDVTVMRGNGDPLNRGTPYAMLAQAVRRLCGIQEGEPLAVQRDKLRARVEPLFPDVAALAPSAMTPGGASPRSRVTHFLGELAGVPFPDGENSQLRAARGDSKGMADQVGRALVDFLQALSQEKPVVLVLEDLHWGDAQSVKLIDTALHSLNEAPLLVLALARPEVHSVFAQLRSAKVQEVNLVGLGRRASERLVRLVLGHGVPPATLAQIVTQADGNALYLEELIRDAAAGRGEARHSTVLAMLQARLLRLDGPARRVLRLASVFGPTFWRGGIRALCADPIDETLLSETLRMLQAAELIEPHTESRVPGDEEYVFRHALVSDAAYGLLTDEDRRVGHQLAGQFLEAAGEANPMVVAEHYRRGGCLERAIAPYTCAAEQALAAHDLDAALERVRLAIGCRAEGVALGTLHGLCCMAHFWRDDFEAGYTHGALALSLLPPGEQRYMQALGNMLTFTSLLGKHAEFRRLVGDFGVLTPSPKALGAYVEAASLLVSMFSFGGSRGAAEGFLRRLLLTGQPLFDRDPVARAWARQAQVIFLLMLDDDVKQARQLASEGLDATLESGSRHHQILISAFLGMAYAVEGNHAQAESVLRGNLANAQALHEPLSINHAQAWLALALSRRDDDARVAEAGRLAVELLQSRGANAFYVLAAQVALSAARLRAGDLAGAAAAYQAGSSLHAYLPTLHCAAMTTQLVVLQRLGQADELARLAAQAREVLLTVGVAGLADAPLRATLAAIAPVAQSGTGGQGGGVLGGDGGQAAADERAER